MSSPVAASALDKSGARVRGMFGRIAPRYDLLNRLLSGGTDVVWRRKAARLLAPRAGERILDLCSGTADLALEISRRSGGKAKVAAADFTLEMLALGRRKIAAAGARIPETGADGMRLPFPDRTFDGATAAFGVRNFEDFDRGCREVARVLKPGGRFVILEFTPAPTGPLSPVVRFHTRVVVPRLGALLSPDAGAYQYLPSSVEKWPAPDALVARLLAAGFASATYERLLFGIAAVHMARKGAP